MESKVTFGLIVGTRNIFSSKLAASAREVLLQKMDKFGFNYVMLPAGETPTGAIETVADARKCAKIFNENLDKIDGIIVVLPNFGDELGIVNALRETRIKVPVLIQACDDDNDKVDVYSRRDAFCGKLSVCNNLYQYGIPFTDTTYHTYPLDSKEFDADLMYFLKYVKLLKGYRMPVLALWVPVRLLSKPCGPARNFFRLRVLRLLQLTFRRYLELQKSSTTKRLKSCRR
jgi:L-fucose isomerase-like protein